ncbi:Homoserine dehydrogenase [seawater metagenome]|uniref:Homoserine dehydrogenase n=1 Tax=seawater metagenome TaxID=1561972 RepID=A0A5E8CHR5_9ZZZZ
MIVCKFGGSSISSAQNIKLVEEIIKGKLNKCNQIILVLSAIGKTTDGLLEIGKLACNNNCYSKNLEILKENHNQIIKNLELSNNDFIKENLEKYWNSIENICSGITFLRDFSSKTSDHLLSFGEKISNLIVFEYIRLQNLSYKVKLLDAENFIITDYNYGNAKVLESKTTTNLRKLINYDQNLLVVPGFISKNESEFTTTLGRGGGDYTAALFGAYLNADKVEIWSDTNGIMTSDPNIVKKARPIRKISYNEMMELSHYGSNIIYAPTILPLYKKKVPIYVKNTFNANHHGTIIDFEEDDEKKMATSISSIKDITLIKIYGNFLIANIGFSSNLFNILSNNKVNIIMISQSSSEHSIYIVIKKNDFEVTQYCLSSAYEKQIDNGEVILKFWNDKSVLAIETNKSDNITLISSKIYSILRQYHIKLYTQTTSDHNLCLIIDSFHLHSLHNLLHTELFAEKQMTNIFLIGVGLVGNELVRQINKLDNLNLICIANSQKIIFDLDGIYTNNIEKELNQKGNKYSMDKIVDQIINSKLVNKVFIDCTSSSEIYNFYEILLENSVSVVTPNKKANTAELNLYKTLSSFDNYKYETTVGAGLPIITGVKNMIDAGDEIIKIEAILSGTLSYIFNTFSESEENFLNIVKKAQELGFTEPNPKDDLNGLDVVRKILILSRLLGLNMEIEDVQNESFLSNDCLNSDSSDSFYNALEDYQEEIIKKKLNAKSKNKVLKHIATLENNKASVGLVELENTHPFSSLKGSDNMIIITSKYYNENKLIIRGPGAGAEVTAAGIIADIRLCR